MLKNIILVLIHYYVLLLEERCKLAQYGPGLSPCRPELLGHFTAQETRINAWYIIIIIIIIKNVKIRVTLS